MQDYSVWYQNHGGTPKDQKLLPQTPQEQGKIPKAMKLQDGSSTLCKTFANPLPVSKRYISGVQGLQKCREKKGMKFKVST